MSKLIINMLKRKPETQYTREGLPIEQTTELEDTNISTPEEIKNRKIYRVKRPTALTKKGFVLQSKLVPDNLEAELLQNKTNVVDFLSIPDEEVKELSPEKQKTFEKFENLEGKTQNILQKPEETEKKSEKVDEKPKNFENPLSAIIKNLESKKSEELVNSFISSSTPKTEKKLPIASNFYGTPQKNMLECLVSVKSHISVNHNSRGQGFIEIAKGFLSEKKICSVIFKNQIKNIVYQAVLPSDTQLKECKVWELGEVDGNYEEVEIEAYKNVNGKTVKENLRILIDKADRKTLQNGLNQAKSFLIGHN